jgi:hypothetical protein
VKLATRTKQLSQFIDAQIQYLESPDFQLWVQNKTPRSLHPLIKFTFNYSLNYALDWIRPELYRHAFKITMLNLTSIQAILRCGQRSEIPFSALASGLEQSLKLFFSQHLGGTDFEMEISGLQFQKKFKWDHDLQIKFSFDEKKLDHDLYLLQINNFHEFENQVLVKLENKKTSEPIDFKVILKLVPTLIYSNKKGS